MTLFVEDLFAYLAAAGTSAEERFHPFTLPQQPTFPAATYTQVSSPRNYTHSGLTNLRQPRFQFDCYSTDYLAAHQLANEIKDALDIFAIRGGFSVQASFIEDDGRDNHDPETGRYWVSVDAIIQTSK